MRSLAICSSALLLLLGCKKEEVKQYTVELEATCYDCIVQYAAGPDRGRYDTLSGSVEGADTLRETGRYSLVMEENEALFFRACRYDPDTVFGDIELRASGAIAPVSTSVGTDAECAVINQAVSYR